MVLLSPGRDQRLDLRLKRVLFASNWTSGLSNFPFVYSVFHILLRGSRGLISFVLLSVPSPHFSTVFLPKLYARSPPPDSHNSNSSSTKQTVFSPLRKVFAFQVGLCPLLPAPLAVLKLRLTPRRPVETHWLMLLILLGPLAPQHQ